MTDLLWWIIFDVLLPFLFYRLFKNPSRPKLPWGTKLLYTLLALITFISLLISLLGFAVALLGLMMNSSLTAKDLLIAIHLLVLPIFNGVMLFIIPRLITTQAIISFIGMVISANFLAWIGFGGLAFRVSTNTDLITTFVIYAICLFCFVLSVIMWVWSDKIGTSESPITPPKRRNNVNQEPDFLRSEK